MPGAPRAHEDQVQLLFSNLGIADGFSMSAVLALNVPSSAQGRVFDALGVNLEIFCLSGVVRPVDAIVLFVALAGFLRTVTLLALEGKEPLSAVQVLAWVKHVVALGAEAHTFELVCTSDVLLRLREKHL